MISISRECGWLDRQDWSKCTIKQMLTTAVESKATTTTVLIIIITLVVAACVYKNIRLNGNLLSKSL